MDRTDLLVGRDSCTPPHPSRYRIFAISMAYLSLALAITPISPAELLPFHNQFLILLKVLTYDLTLTERAGSEVTLGILASNCQDLASPTLEEVDSVLTELESVKLEGLPLNHVLLVWESADELFKQISDHNLDALYILPGNEPHLEDIQRVCRTAHILSMTGVAEHVASGITVGVVADPQTPLLINISAAREEKVSFATPLLRIARIIE